MTTALVDEVVHLFRDHIGGVADALEHAEVFQQRGDDLAVPCALGDLREDMHELAPTGRFGRKDVAHPGAGLELRHKDQGYRSHPAEAGDLYAVGSDCYGCRVRRLLVTLTLLVAVSCAADDETGPTSAAPTSTPTTVPVPLLDAADCPIADAAFCAAAAEVANALRGGDVESLVALSTPDSIVCAEMNLEYFPGCTTADTLTGYGFSGPDLVVEFHDEAEFSDRVQTFVDATDTAAVGSFRIGTCGPDIPGRRTYHVAWAADGVLGSFEMRFDDDWRIVLVYPGAPVSEWESSQSFPLDELFCSASAPWPG